MSAKRFSPVLTSTVFRKVSASRNAMGTGTDYLYSEASPIAPETVDAAAALRVQLPDFDWTIEVDALGHHRITVHLSGNSISVDE